MFEHTTCVVDTSVLMEAKFITEIDWQKELNAKNVLLVLPKAVLDELDKHKFDPTSDRRRDRARTVVRKVHDLGDDVISEAGAVLRHGVRLRVFTKQPAMANYPDLDPSGDDRILASVHDLQNEVGEVQFLSADYGAILKAKSLGINAAFASDDIMLPAERSKEQKEIEKLRRQLLDHQKRESKLDILLVRESTNSQTICLKRRLLREPTEEEYEARLDEIQNRLRYQGPVVAGPSVPHWMFPTRSNIERYEHEVEGYITQYRGYLDLSYEVGQSLARSVELGLRITNEGTAPAQDVIVELRCPEQVVLSEELSKMPEAPKPPSPPKGQFESLIDYSSLSLASISGLRTFAGQSYADPKFEGPVIYQGSDYQVTYKIKRVMHNLPWHLPTFVLTLPLGVHQTSFDIRARLHAANQGAPVEKDLHLVIEDVGEVGPWEEDSR